MIHILRVRVVNVVLRTVLISLLAPYFSTEAGGQL
jgi:hypothetical protein